MGCEGAQGPGGMVPSPEAALREAVKLGGRGLSVPRLCPLELWTGRAQAGKTWPAAEVLALSAVGSTQLASRCDAPRSTSRRSSRSAVK